MHKIRLTVPVPTFDRTRSVVKDTSRRVADKVKPTTDKLKPHAPTVEVVRAKDVKVVEK